ERVWHSTQMQAVWLTSSVQIGFVVGAVGSAALNLPDRIPPQIVAGSASIGAALTTAAIAIWVDAFLPAIILRILTGMFLAGVYPVAMQLDRKSTRLNSSHVSISYAVFCLKNKTIMLVC